MNYNLLSLLVSWIFPTRADRQTFRDLCHCIQARKTNKIIQNQYNDNIKRLQKKNSLNVIFLINESAKWKYQSLYEKMLTSDLYNPKVVLTISDIQTNLSKSEKEAIINNNFKYFKNKNINAISKYDINANKALSLKDLDPDIIFYQQPYALPKIQAPKETSKYALTCYVPYYLPDYKNLKLDCGHEFHHQLFRFYVLNDRLRDEYKNYLSKKNIYYSNIKAVGHTMVDLLTKNTAGQNKEYVIYAPHWSIKNPNNENIINIATFELNGEKILNFAKSHPEINWVFKPHPTLKCALKRIGWSDDSINNYYSEWEKIALTSYDGDYADIFLSSKAMITDSGSFLLEYFITGKPLIHLISDFSENAPYHQLSEYFDTFYKAYNNEYLDNFLNEVILNNNDIKLPQRKKLIDEAEFIRTNAAENIINDLSVSIFGGTK